MGGGAFVAMGFLFRFRKERWMHRLNNRPCEWRIGCNKADREGLGRALWMDGDGVAAVFFGGLDGCLYTSIHR